MTTDQIEAGRMTCICGHCSPLDPHTYFATHSGYENNWLEVINDRRERGKRWRLSFSATLVGKQSWGKGSGFNSKASDSISTAGRSGLAEEGNDGRGIDTNVVVPLFYQLLGFTMFNKLFII